MGIKDWFGGGDKKKAEFREEAKKLASEGLTPKTAAQLEALREEHGIDDAGDDKTVLRREIYNSAAAQVQAKGKLSAGEAAELAKIQKFLALRDDQVEKTKRDLTKLRVLTEIRQGRLPVVPKENSALRGVALEPGEVPHYAVQVDILDRPSTSGRDGVAVKWDTPYATNSARVQKAPLDGAKPKGDGYLFVTSKRLIVKSPQGSAVVNYTPQANIFLYAEGVRVARSVGHAFFIYKAANPDTSEILGELLAALMKAESA